MKNLRRAHDSQRRESYADRGLGGFNDGYEDAELKRLTQDPLKDPGKVGINLRTRLDILSGHFYVTRGETHRNCELPDLSAIELPDEGMTECICALLAMSRGKMNKYGRMQYMGAVRNKDVDICPVGALALYFFYRWHISGEPFPTFRRRSDWYRVKVLVGSNREKPMAYPTQLECTNAAFEKSKITSTSKTMHQGKRVQGRQSCMERPRHR